MKFSVSNVVAGALMVAAVPAFAGDTTRVAGNANNQFGIELFKKTTKVNAKGNKFLSPTSAYLALGMTLNGAGGETAKAMSLALGASKLSLDAFNAANLTFVNSLTSRSSDFKFDIANAIWSKKGHKLQGEFINRVEDFYRSTAAELDFDAPESVSVVNDWASHESHGKIQKIVEKFGADLRVLLVNSTFFDAKWSFPFNKSYSREKEFTRQDGQTVMVPTMALTAELQYAKLPDAEVVSLPYGRRQTARMIVVKPRDLKKFENSLTAQSWSQLTATLAKTKAELGSIQMPSLELEYNSSLNDSLKGMGMGVAFSDSADFTAMLGESLFISDVIQKTYLKVYEEGTIAAAITSVGGSAASIGPELKFDLALDRPYLVAIEDVPSGAILFMASISEPEGGKLPTNETRRP